MELSGTAYVQYACADLQIPNYLAISATRFFAYCNATCDTSLLLHQPAIKKFSISYEIRETTRAAVRATVLPSSAARVCNRVLQTYE